MGLYYSQIFNTTAESNYQHSEHTRIYVSEQPFYSSVTIPSNSQDSSNTTASDRLQHTTQDHNLQQSILLPTNTGPQYQTAQRCSVPASPALEVQNQQSHYRTRFTATCSNMTIKICHPELT
jgi:hypothetical protein